MCSVPTPTERLGDAALVGGVLHQACSPSCLPRACSPPLCAVKKPCEHGTRLRAMHRQPRRTVPCKITGATKNLRLPRIEPASSSLRTNSPNQLHLRWGVSWKYPQPYLIRANMKNSTLINDALVLPILS
jgi:hypothetical protein